MRNRGKLRRRAALALTMAVFAGGLAAVPAVAVPTPYKFVQPNAFSGCTRSTSYPTDWYQVSRIKVGDHYEIDAMLWNCRVGPQYTGHDYVKIIVDNATDSGCYHFNDDYYHHWVFNPSVEYGTTGAHMVRCDGDTQRLSVAGGGSW